MNKEILSIVVPVTQMAGRLQNLEKWILEAIDLGIEVLLIHDFRDNATSDELHALVARLSHPNIRLEENMFGNQGSARNYGKALSRGEWIAFWDSDDLGKPRKLLQVVTSAKSNTDLIIAQYESVDPSLNVLSRSSTNYLRNVPKSVGLWRMVFRNRSFSDVHFPELRMAEDQVFFARCLAKARKIEIVSDSLYSYVQGNSGQITKNSEALMQIPTAMKLLFITFTKVRNPIKAMIVFTMTLRLTVTHFKRKLRRN